MSDKSSSESWRARYPLTILERHLDSFAHVNNAKYMEIFEEARWDWITSAGYGLEEIRKTGLGPTVLEAKLSFRKELRLRQEVEVLTRVVEYRSKVGTLQQRIQDSEGVVYCEAEYLIGLFDVNKRKLVTPTERWLEALGQVR